MIIYALGSESPLMSFTSRNGNFIGGEPVIPTAVGISRT